MSGSTDKYPSVGTSLKIDQRAEKIFHSWLPDDWLARKQTPDFFVDYVVERVERGEPTGLHFGVQIKGYEGRPGLKQPFSHRFETKHLRYYLERSQNPVFLFLIDVATEEGCWVFAQEYLKRLQTDSWKDQQSLTVHFTANDSLSNFIKFNCLLPDAERFVRDLHPGSVQAALEKRRRELEAKDARCSVSISVKDGAEHFVISAKEPVSFDLHFKGGNHEKWREFIERGTELKVESGEIEIKGSPLYEELSNTMGGCTIIQFGNPQPSSIRLICGIGEELSMLNVDGTSQAGTKFITFTGRLKDSPFELSVDFPYRDADPVCSLTVGFCFERWSGKRVLFLPHFDDIETFARAVATSTTTTLHWSVHGNILLKAPLPSLAKESAESILKIMQWLRKCKWLAQHFKVSPTLSNLNKITRDEWDGLDDIYAVLTHGKVETPIPRHRLTFTARATQDAPIEHVWIRFEKPMQIVDLFDVPVSIGPTTTTFTKLRFVSKEPNGNGKAKFTFETTPESLRTFCLKQ